jgi:DNA repair exonuclease SbcCD ATPase subunit
MSTITKLEIENFKRLSAVSITPDGSTVVLGGKNAQGKSSVLDAIQAALGGVKHSPQDPIKHGTKGARVVLETEALVVSRKWTAKGSQLEVKGKDGSRFSSPQQMLDELWSSLTFDPSRFARMKPPEQAETLRQLVGLDFSQEDAKRQEYYDKRTDVGRELRRLQGAIEKMPEVPAGTPDTEYSVEELNEELERRIQHNRQVATKEVELTRKRDRATATIREIEATRARLEQLEKDLAQINAEGMALRAEVDAFDRADEDEARQHLMNAAKVNSAVRAKSERAKLEAELDAAMEQSEELTRKIELIDEVKAKAAAEAKYPIDGLELHDGQVTFEGVPFEQASQAQRLRVSVAMGLALNPELKVLLVRDGSYLDSEGLRIVSEMASAAGGQVWIERVSDDGKGCTVVISDGAVVEAEAKDGAA